MEVKVNEYLKEDISQKYSLKASTILVQLNLIDRSATKCETNRERRKPLLGTTDYYKLN